MFCPPGFRSVCELPSLLPEAAEKLAAQHIYELYGIGLPSGEWSLGFLFHCSPKDHFEIRLFQAIRGNVFACSPTGSVLRLDAGRVIDTFVDCVVTLSDLIGAVSRDLGLGGIPEYFEYSFGLSQVDRDEFTSEMRDRAIGRIEMPSFADECGVLRTHQQIPMFYERAGYTISLQGYDFVSQTDFLEPVQFRDMARILSPFEGWSLCVPEDFALTELPEAFNAGLAVPSVGSGLVRGRPSTRRMRTYAAYRTLFPDGHDGRSWLEVLRDVNRVTGLAASVDTLKRALRDGDDQQKSD